MTLISLSAGGDTAVVDPDRGARIASLTIGGRERLVTREASDGSDTGWGCFLMVPWAGRVSGALVPFGGKRYRVRENLPPHGIHGVGFDKAWDVLESGGTGCRLALTMPEDQWPFGGRVIHGIDLSEGRLDLSARVTAAKAMPVTLGWHPWFARPPGGDVAVTVPSHSMLVTTEDLIPTGASEPVSGAYDLRDGPLLGDRRLDTVFVAPEGPGRVAWPDLTLEISMTEPLTTMVVYTPEGAACVEPQTSWPDAFRLDGMGIEGVGLLTLAPGREVLVRTSLEWTHTT